MGLIAALKVNVMSEKLLIIKVLGYAYTFTRCFRVKYLKKSISYPQREHLIHVFLGVPVSQRT